MCGFCLLVELHWEGSTPAEPAQQACFCLEAKCVDQAGFAGFGSLPSIGYSSNWAKLIEKSANSEGDSGLFIVWIKDSLDHVTYQV